MRTAGLPPSALLAMALLLPACGPGSGDGSAIEDGELRRHLRLAAEQLRLDLHESAEAELARCAELAPNHPEVLFQRARLALFGRDRPVERETALELLDRVLEADPESVRAHRMLYGIKVSEDPEAAAGHRAAVERLYGPLGKLEMDAYDQYLMRGEVSGLNLPPGAALDETSDIGRLAGALRRLQRSGGYAPGEAVPVIEEVLARYPDLAIVRQHYADILITQRVRVNDTPRPDLPPMSSRLIADYAQAHYERVLDQLPPSSTSTRHNAYNLGEVALRMGDYDDAVRRFDVALAGRLADDFIRRVTGKKGLARYKQGRYDEAIPLLEEALRGAAPAGSLYLTHLWILHMAYEEAGTPEPQRSFPFRLRPDLVRAVAPGGLAFVDVAPEIGIDKLDGLGPSAWGDYDRDGDIDLWVSGCDSYGALYRNEGGRFEDVSREAGLFETQSGFSSTFADYDNDGWPDLYIGRDGWNGPAPNALYRNRGDGTFEDVTARSGLADAGSAFVHLWSDYDRDGDIDLVVANGITGGGDTNRLYRNEGDGTFSDVTEAAGLAEPPGTKTIGLAVGDYDRDGWPDLFVSGYATRNRLYRNRGDGTFEEVAAAAGVADAVDTVRGYVAFFVDYDNDTRPDILRTNLAPWTAVLLALSDRVDTLPESARRQMQVQSPRLYRNNGDGTFSDVSAAAGFRYPAGIMGANVADLDNDGWVDVYFGTGDPQIGRLEPDRFYRNNGDGTFTDLTFTTGLGNIGKGHGVTFVDLDGDGDLEIYAQEGGFEHGDPFPNAFYRNDQRSGNHWIHVDLEGTDSNRDAVGTQLTLHAGGREFYREVTGGRGFGSSDSPTVEFGLGKAARVERLELRWPSGREQVLENLPVDTRIVVREGETWTEAGAGG